MNILVVRHGDAEPAVDDNSRPLSGKGEAEITSLARLLSSISDLDISCIFHSPLVRAARTAALLGDSLGAKCFSIEGLKPCDIEGPALEVALASFVNIADGGTTGNKQPVVVLVGHLPNIHYQCALLTGVRNNAAPFIFETGSAFFFGAPDSGTEEPEAGHSGADFPTLTPGHHTLKWGLHAGCHFPDRKLPSAFGCLFLLAIDKKNSGCESLTELRHDNGLVSEALSFLDKHNLKPELEFPAQDVIESSLLNDYLMASEKSALITGTPSELNAVTSILLGKSGTLPSPANFSDGFLACLSRHNCYWGFGWLITPQIIRRLPVPS